MKNDRPFRQQPHPSWVSALTAEKIDQNDGTSRITGVGATIDFYSRLVGLKKISTSRIKEKKTLYNMNIINDYTCIDNICIMDPTLNRFYKPDKK